MEKFSEVYALARSMLGNKCLQKWSPDYQTKFEALFAEAGPDETQAKALDSIHFLLGSPGAQPAVKSPVPIWERLRPPKHPQPDKAPTAAQYADWLIDFAKMGLANPAGQIHDQCALLKTLMHFYFVSSAGNQSIWVADNLAAYKEWPFVELAGKSEHAIKHALMHNDEIFGAANRQLFADAFAIGRKWCMDAAAKTSAPDANTIALVKRWFGVGHSDNLDDVVQWVSMSFNWLSQAFNCKHVIFADDPLRRAGGKRLPLASTFFGKDEAMRVIHIYKPFFEFGRKTRAGAMPKLWYAALIIVHELAHKEIGADDTRYDNDGIKLGPHLSPEQAIMNADSFAYYAADLAGALSQRDFRWAYR